MSEILKASGFVLLESLVDFSTRYPNVPNCLDIELEKVWICHKCSKNIPKFEEIILLKSDNYFNLLNKFKKKVDDSKNFVSSLTEFKVLSVFQKIYSHFKGVLTLYILSNCYLFFNWGVNSFEPIIDHFEINEKIENRAIFIENVKQLNNCKSLFTTNKPNTKLKGISLKGDSVVKQEKLCLSKKNKIASKCSYFKKVTTKSFKIALSNSEPYFDLPLNPNDPSQEIFNVKKIMYDVKEKSSWPRNHVLSKFDEDQLLKFIIYLPVSSKNFNDYNIFKEYKKWSTLNNLLKVFLKNHEKINEKNGYGRILKKHLRNVKITSNRKLVPISKTIVSSFLIDILRRVLPLEMFGCNRLRKKFFSCLVKIISASKEENFMWCSTLKFLFKEKSKIIWCNQINNNNAQNLIILKLFKFIIMNYIFVLIKNNFYVTETGSSGFGLRFYRKCDIERASSLFLKKLLTYKHLRNLKKQDHFSFTLERKWIDTGIIDEKDFDINCKKIMDPSHQFVQGVASVRFMPKNDWSDQMRIITYIKPKKTNVLGKNNEAEKILKAFEGRLAWRKKKLFYVKLFIDFLVNKTGFGIKPVPNNPKIEAAWNKAIYLKESFGNLYFVKTDIADAFDSVKHDLLIKILKEEFHRESFENAIELKKITEWKLFKNKIRKVTRLSFSNRPEENSVLFNRSVLVSDYVKSTKNLDFIDIINQIVMQQRVEINGKVFKLIKGLAQGSAGKFSPQLCEIYYSSMDKLYFGDVIDSHNCILLRGVDDYLFISADIKKTERFLEIVRGGIQYFNARFNNEKLVTNLIENVHEVSYLGLTFNFSNMSVKPNYFKYQKQNLLSTIKLTDAMRNIHFNKNYFLERKSLCFNSLKLQPILLNKNHNNLKIIRQIVFQACLMQSVRIMSLSKYLFDGKAKNELVVWRIVMKTRNKLNNLLKSFSCLDKFEVDWLFFFAVIYVFQKFSGQFKNLLIFGRFKLKNCEKIWSNNGSELLPKFIRNDIFNLEFWIQINKIFGKSAFNTKPFAIDQSIKD